MKVNYRGNPNLSRLPTSATQTYIVSKPKATHWRRGTCMEVNCEYMEHGWRTVVDENTDLGQRQAHYIRSVAGRKFKESKLPDGLTSFEFEPGQKCFTEHRVDLQRPENYLLRRDGLRRFDRADQWIEHFNEHNERLRRG